MLPDRLLARKVISYSTFGNARQVNHPFAPLLSPEDFAGLDFSQNRLVRSPEALLERLDNGTCQGCHQSGATAGFHFIGLDDKFTSPLNRIEVGISPHFHAELPRRDAYVAAVRDGREPNRFRPLSFAPPADWTDDAALLRRRRPVAALPDAERTRRASAATGNAAPARSARRLPPATRRAITLAQCLPPPDTEMYSGLPCLQGAGGVERGAAVQGPVPADAVRRLRGEGVAVDYTCRPPRIGVPGGLAYRSATRRTAPLRRSSRASRLPPEICGLTGGKAFDVCVAPAISTNAWPARCSAATARAARPSISAATTISARLSRPTRRASKGQGRRLLLADLLHVPDAHRQPHDALEEPRARRLPIGRGG